MSPFPGDTIGAQYRRFVDNNAATAASSEDDAEDDVSVLTGTINGLR